jgi:putative endonuclease
MKAKDLLGRHGETLAVAFLETQGMRIMDRNWRCSEGEIDIVALDGDTLVIAEVKTRKNLAYGHPFEAVGAAKLARLHRLAFSWCRDHELRACAAGWMSWESSTTAWASHSSNTSGVWARWAWAEATLLRCWA